MKKIKIEYETVPLRKNEVREAQYMLDDHKLKILNNKNKLELLQYQIDNDIPKSIIRNNIISMKEHLKNYKKDLNKLEKEEISELEKADKKIILLSTMKSCKQQIGEKELEIKLNLPSRDLNKVIEKTEEELNRSEHNFKVYQKMVRNKTKRVVKQRVQLSGESQ